VAEAPPAVAGILLAGGQSRRMGGGDKCLLPLAGRPLLAHILERIRPQLRALAINANGPPERFAAFGLPVVADSVAGYPGPLAGILAGLDWAAAAAPGCAWLVSIPSDAPFLPQDLVPRLMQGVAGGAADLACAASGGRSHPVVGLWPLRLREALRLAVAGEGIRKVDRWTARYRLATVAFAAEPVDPFFNANEPGDLAAAERLAKAAAG
jgi:molybdopterin-guanine dinucleotide biosynthesis protein A